MENNTEKKWFVYVKDHHEGPHSLLEIQEKLIQGRVESEGFVWSEGMEEWQRMTDVSAFQPLLKNKPLGLGIQPKTWEPDPLSEAKAPDLKSPSKEDPTEGEPSPAPSTRSRLLMRGGITLALLTGLVGASRLGYLDPLVELPVVQRLTDQMSQWTRPILLKAVETLPFTESWISPIPRLDDVSPDDFEELKRAARASLKKHGPQFAIGLSRSHPGAPSFYVTTNAGEGFKFRIFVVGIPDTLLNQLSFISETESVVTQALGKTDAIRYADGRVIPRGEYRVVLTAAEDQPAAVKAALKSAPLIPSDSIHELTKSTQVLAVKSYFLAGNKDRSYQERLKDFHEKLRARASSEMTEAKQFMITLSSQFDLTQDKFTQLGKAKPTPQQRKQWEKFHNEWSKMQGELDQIFQKWSPESLKNEYFYGEFFQLLQSLGHSVSQVHGLQHGYFTGVQGLKDVHTTVKAESIETVRLLELIKGKVERAEKLPPTPSGMPQREVW